MQQDTLSQPELRPSALSLTAIAVAVIEQALKDLACIVPSASDKILDPLVVNLVTDLKRHSEGLKELAQRASGKPAACGFICRAGICCAL